jgi:aerobic-type carbon monoxide dehydrogenase small subunit (CoxS/CutS family)
MKGFCEMAKVINATNRFEQKRKNDEYQQIEKAVKGLVEYCTQQEIITIYELLEAKDEKGFFEFLDSILRRLAFQQAMKELNT